jgi:hypothetical protein
LGAWLLFLFAVMILMAALANLVGVVLMAFAAMNTAIALYRRL